jgi:hypothetical protein
LLDFSGFWGEFEGRRDDFGEKVLEKAFGGRFKALQDALKLFRKL